MINAEKLQAAGIDYEAGLSRFMNDSDFYEAILNAFLEEGTLEKSRQAFVTNDYDGMFRAVHEAKGSSGNAGFMTLYTEASALVALLRSNNFTKDELCEYFTRFEKEYTKVYNGIKSALQ